MLAPGFPVSGWKEDAMEIREPKSKAAPAALDWSAAGYSVAAKSLQMLAEEIGQISAANFQRNTKLLEDLRSARTVEDLVSIQTKFMAAMFETFNDHVRLMGSRLSELRNDIVDAGSNVSAVAPAPTAPAAPAPDAGINQAIEATNVAALANIKASQEITRSAFQAAEKAADTIRNAFSTDVLPPASNSGG
jgi:hypothetical protein